MARVLWLAIALSCSAIAATTTAAAAAAGSQPGATPEVLAPLAQWDRDYDALRNYTWQAQQSSALLGSDLRGRTLSIDTRALVLAPAATRELQELRERAGRDELQAMALARSALDAQGATMTRLWAYWDAVQATGFVRPLWEKVAAASTPEARGASEQRVAAILAEMKQLLAARSIDDEVVSAARSLVAMYNDERVGLLKHGLPPGALPGLARERLTPCPAPVAAPADAPAGTRAASVLRAGLDLSDFYPAVASRYNIGGPVIVQIQVSAAGCPLQFTVQQSSGSLPLDAAALEWLEVTRFVPATVDGRAEASAKGVRVNFISPAEQLGL